ncbi:MAG: signal peptidase I [Anaerolineae bacterium]|jgi:signal peptidase I
MEDPLGAVPHSSQSDGNEPGLAASVGRFLFRLVRELVGTIVPAVLIALFINVFVAQAMVVHGPSMEPNLFYDERVVVEKVTYRLQGPHRGDVVVIDVPGQAEPLIKRVVGLPGDRIAIRGGRVFIDDVSLDEPWTDRVGGLDYPEMRVPAGQVFVLGDNRAHSNDSRSFGPVSIDRIVGRAWVIYWPLDEAGLIR